jgi:hypothetical protein
MRYALIVGNNTGIDSDGTQPFPPLKHAEREATDLKNSLVGLANFDASRQRTRLLTGATLSQVNAAFEAIKRQKEQDEKFFKSMESIFLFYFTGHGLEGRILLKDGAVSSETLAALFNSIDADLSVGVFDACHSGSLDGVLSEKGIRTMPGFNMIRSLPSEVLSAKGSIWYVSSHSGQMSYEDKALGGVFTHFFIEALKHAPKEGPGIPLENIWQYVRRETVSYTASRNRVQIPEQIIKLRSSAPVYFSFPVPRSATLVLSEGFDGRFALEYADGHLTEVFEKKRGTRHEVAIYPGRARLVLIDETSDVMADKVFEISSGGTLILQGMPEVPVRPPVGERAAPLFPKGLAIRDRLTATKLEPRFSFISGVGYAFSYTDRDQIHPRHRIAIPFRFDFKRAMLDVAVNLGLDRRQYDWAYRAFMVGGELRSGFCLDVKAVRLNINLGFSFGHIAQQYQDQNHTDATKWEFYPTGGISAVFPRTSKALAEVYAFVGPLISPGQGIDGTMGVQTAGGVGATFYLRLI